MPPSECQWKEEEEEAEGLEAFHLYLLGEGPCLEDTAGFLGLDSELALGCGFSVFPAVPKEPLLTLSKAALGLRALRVIRGLFAEVATHL